MRPPASKGRGFGGRGRGGGKGGRGFGKGRGGRGPEGPPDSVEPVGTLMHDCEGDLVCKLTHAKVPYFNASIYVDKNTRVGKVDEILTDLEAVPVTRALRVLEITTGDVTEISGRASRLFEEQTEGDPDFTGVEVEVDAVNGTILAVGEDASLLLWGDPSRYHVAAIHHEPDASCFVPCPT